MDSVGRRKSGFVGWGETLLAQSSRTQPSAATFAMAAESDLVTEQSGLLEQSLEDMQAKTLVTVEIKTHLGKIYTEALFDTLLNE